MQKYNCRQCNIFFAHINSLQIFFAPDFCKIKKGQEGVLPGFPGWLYKRGISEDRLSSISTRDCNLAVECSKSSHCFRGEMNSPWRLHTPALLLTEAQAELGIFNPGNAFSISAGSSLKYLQSEQL